MPELIPVLDKEAIACKVADVARQISNDYQNSHLVLIGVLKGAFIFMADLIREIEVECLNIDFVRVASYGDHSQSSGCIRLIKDIETDISGKDVLIVEDILDSGLTMAYLRDHLAGFSPRSLKICVMLDKPHKRRVAVQAEYVCHTVTENGFLVGYGLDYAESYRNLPAVYELKLG
ncbi:MAG: hypoxanthine phosphoribosyltransferase [Planctomycetaceae bacterium]|nr:MAG: hypoxanthine phosphoribosyltransferase [Planctomycetaceae bacterium]